MAYKICKRGEHEKRNGGGIYFICHYDWQEKDEQWRKESPCRFTRWCDSDQRYCASTDKDGKTCPHFLMLRPEVDIQPPEVRSAQDKKEDLEIEKLELILDIEEEKEKKTSKRSSYKKVKTEKGESD